MYVLATMGFVMLFNNNNTNNFVKEIKKRLKKKKKKKRKDSFAVLTIFPSGPGAPLIPGGPIPPCKTNKVHSLILG